MQSTKQQLLRNPKINPTNDVIAEALGQAYNAYLQFVNELASHDIHLEWRYYDDGKAWLAKGLYKWTGARGGQNEKTVFWLSIWDGFFKATLYLPAKSRGDARLLPLDDKVKQMISDAEQMGKLKYYPIVFEINTDEMFDAIFALADFKKNINR
jgi:hypothetical protein